MEEKDSERLDFVNETYPGDQRVQFLPYTNLQDTTWLQSPISSFHPSSAHHLTQNNIYSGMPIEETNRFATNGNALIMETATLGYEAAQSAALNWILQSLETLPHYKLDISGVRYFAFPIFSPFNQRQLQHQILKYPLILPFFLQQQYNIILPKLLATQGRPEQVQFYNPSTSKNSTEQENSSSFFQVTSDTISLNQFRDSKRRFTIIEEPYESQRKSYEKENRCILPNPISICPVVTIPNTILRSGTVTASLLDQNGAVYTSPKGQALGAVDGFLTKPLNPDGCAVFSLKVLQTSDNQNFRLQFHVKYELVGVGQCEEFIVTRPFCVYSNKSNRLFSTSKFLLKTPSSISSRQRKKKAKKDEAPELQIIPPRAGEDLDPLPLDLVHV